MAAYFTEQLAEARKLSADLESLDAQVGEHLIAVEALEAVDDARNALNDILWDDRYHLLDDGAAGLAGRQQRAVSRATGALRYDDWRVRSSLTRRLDLIDRLQEDIDNYGEQTVVQQLHHRLETLMDIAREKTDLAMAQLRLVAPSEQ